MAPPHDITVLGSARCALVDVQKHKQILFRVDNMFERPGLDVCTSRQPAETDHRLEQGSALVLCVLV
jgi:hypothetical protein